MGHGKSDRLYISAAEHSGVYGEHGASRGKHGLQIQSASSHPVPFDCCALSFQPWKNPVCSSDNGTIFELTNLIPYVRKYGTHPVTGNVFDLQDVVKLNFTKVDGHIAKFQDPVSFKHFTEHSHIVAIRTTGNVYLHETIQRLNIKPKLWKDLLTEQEFTKKDILTLQDPDHPELRHPQSMHHVKEGLALTQADKGIDTSEQLNIAATGSAKSLLTKLKDQEDQRNGNLASSSSSPSASTARDTATSTSSPIKSNVKTSVLDSNSPAYTRYKPTGVSTGKVAASLTSSSLTPRTANERVVLDDEEKMFQHVKTLTKGGKAYVRLTTNFGPLNLELHCDKAPKTSFNFLELCKKGYYDDTVFHRNIPGFMIQGGDPTGTGRGGESIWGGSGFRDEHDVPGSYKHTSRGILSMANKGPGTNGSQFFLTYRSVPHLDGKHTVFGRLVDGEKDQTLTKMEQVPCDPSTDRPLRTIRILNVLITENPFEKYQLKQQQLAKTSDPNDLEYKRKLDRKRARDQDRTTWLGTQLPSHHPDKDVADTPSASFASISASTSASGIGKYLPSTHQTQPSKSKTAQAITSLEPSTKKKKTAGFGDFSSW